jgi:AcrR family transcriptional regulator
MTAGLYRTNVRAATAKIGSVTPRTQTQARGRGRESRRTRAAILERAVDLASIEGLEGLTIGRLASELRMSKSGLFGHFGSKEELQLATIEDASARFIGEVIDPALAEPEGEPRLRALCTRYIDYLERGVFAGGCFFGAASIEFDDRPGPVGDRVRDAVGAWVGYLEAQAAAAGAHDPKLVAFELHALGQGANSAFRLFGDSDIFVRARKAIGAVIDDQLARKPAPRRVRRQASRRAK